MSISCNVISVGAGSAYERSIAVKRRMSRAAGSQCGLFWLGGFKSNMDGTKALHVDAYAEQMGLAYTRFDYSGHGISGGDFVSGTISRWCEEAISVFRSTEGSQVVIGSSMGGWISLLMSLRLLGRMSRNDVIHHLPDGRIAAVVLIAPAVDFTEQLIWLRLSPDEQDKLLRVGYYDLPSTHSCGSVVITRELIEDGRKNLLLGGFIDLGCPVYIVQGVDDVEVPWRYSLLLLERISGVDMTISLIHGGDHSLDRPSDLETISRVIDMAVSAAR